MKKYTIIFPLLLCLFIGCRSEKTETQKQTAHQAAGKEHRCANCGMLTSKYPNWEEIIVLSSGDTLYFDGPRCMFFTLLNSDKTSGGIKTVKVKDYYTLNYIDGENAFYVIGSDVMGPMGKELIPFVSEEAAKQFLKDHQGERIIRFNDVNLQLIKQLAGKMNM